MKKVLVILMCMNLNAFAQSDLNLAEQKATCGLIKDIIPHEREIRVTIKSCMSDFQFDLISENQESKEVEVIANTVEDSAVVCTVFLAKNSRHQAKLPQPECDIQ